jgi:hypothetical protein
MDNTPTLITPVLGVATATSINGTTIPSSKTLVATDSTTYVVPSQTGNTGKFLTTDGTSSSWAPVDALPSQTGNAGEFLTTDGTTASWSAISGSLAQPTEPTSPTDGQIWVDTDGTAIGNQVVRWSKATANGTTTLSGNDDNSSPLSYVAGYEQVYQNGVLLARGGDYTATNGSTIALTNASVTGDIFEVFASLPVAIVDVYTKAQVDAAFIPDSLIDAKGDIVTATAADTPARLAVGANDLLLTAASGEATGLKYTGDWTSFTPTFSGITIGNGTLTGKYNKIGKVMNVYVRLTFGSTTSITGTVILTIPGSGFPAIGTTCNIIYEDAGIGFYIGNAVIYSGSAYLGSVRSSTTFAQHEGLTATTPMTWTNSDGIIFNASYEVA